MYGLRNSGYKRKAAKASKSKSRSLAGRGGFPRDDADKILEVTRKGGMAAQLVVGAMQSMKPRATWTGDGVLRLKCSQCNLEIGNSMFEFHHCAKESDWCCLPYCADLTTVGPLKHKICVLCRKPWGLAVGNDKG